MSDLVTYGAAASRAVLKRVGRAMSRVQERTALAVDVLESDDEYLLVFDAPGVETRDVEVTAEDGGVTVHFDRYREYRDGFRTLLAGRGLALDGHAELPADAAVDDPGARAELRDDGTLHVYVPKGDAVAIE
ncbi:Hsp20/alpha crystallin family protein [Halarchaeum nitratireducens]|uniref:Heat-shock protein Hsp20 n=1 Tax=Halarchaeum nitratireducens TaxID=489913 RepID=A0A830GAD8_9EURY|nr:Hsp20 family protein [Halarchaeum nitratireducens]MBP2251576.1 HSP20 family molecular chaperone IbpA [Halarchaeum solikamskense]GGN13957.1 heat-shock protein Hsp20 [Halarchaeum nitratireducens]